LVLFTVLNRRNEHQMNKWRSIIQVIQDAQAPEGMNTSIIAIDGPGGAGKSSFAEQLSRQLGGAPILHTDDFASWEHPLDWWPRLLHQVLEPLSRNETARYQRYDWNTKRLAEWHEIQPTKYLLLEGVSSSRDAFQPYITFSIWIETPRQERLRRGLERDGEVARPLWQEWMANEDDYIEREHPQQRADLILDGTQPYDLSDFFAS
jgi:uridine kinase